ncbi:hypothetical protein JCM10908_002500 [Rhodotorula pacifica]|uniref:alpha/beta hydrolase n=1 Tax=Rhodotorula pacifica TaxID=1495444 RepID=UPI003170D3D8
MASSVLSAYLPSLRNVLKWLASTLAVSLTVGGTALYFLQSRLIYPANLPAGSRQNVPRPEEFGMPGEEVELTAPDGVKIKAFVIRAPARGEAEGGNDPSQRPTVLLLHANAGNVGHRLPIAKVFWHKMGCNVVALSYRGYGHSEGSPSEKGIKLDAQTALDFILSHQELERTPIFLYGQSIGGAVAIFLASQNAQRVRGLIIENTFLSLQQLVPRILPFLAPFVPFLLHQIWPSDEAIAKLPADFPVLFLAGSRDELVEPGQMKGLWAKCGSKVKEWREFPHGTHNDTCVQPHYFAHVAAFIAHQTGIADVSFSSSASTSSATTATTASTSSTTAADASSQARPASASVSSTGEDSTPLSTAPGSPSASSSSEGGSSSFEFVEASMEDLPEKQEEQGGIAGAGSLGPKGEVEEVLKEAKDEFRHRQKL